ncbi:hypothetical protein NG798_27290 [Ancylothrix sp. C2]|uniref:hypothetical protein n=1 Tax=Ancylothrix sp. D3o TaxID=2953691 RepID=UPI0021BA8CA1|nr:hypothetical protein [Ancylothrix sp. D3o]MCT7953505.1 hypothetical protein [Ancylothrix sp. D3o]
MANTRPQPSTFINGFSAQTPYPTDTPGGHRHQTKHRQITAIPTGTHGYSSLTKTDQRPRSAKEIK